MSCKMPWWAGSENPPPDKDKIISDLRAEVASLNEERDGVIETFNRQLMKDNALLGARVGELTQQLAAANGRVEMLRKALEHIESHTDSTNDGITYEICRAALSNLNEDRDKSDV
jgi:predicted RNase H-like nuclease (RuvC/YqgF family)